MLPMQFVCAGYSMYDMSQLPLKDGSINRESATAPVELPYCEGIEVSSCPPLLELLCTENGKVIYNLGNHHQASRGLFQLPNSSCQLPTASQQRSGPHAGRDKCQASEQFES